MFSREGANITIVNNGRIADETKGEYGEEGFLFQEYFEVPKFDEKTPIIGSWLIGGEAAGMGIRESDTLITGNMSRFIPHFF